LAPRLATLSALPRTQWHNLVHLDAIRERSRPQQPPKKPEAAPFFLPTVAGLEGRPVFDMETGQPAESQSRVLAGATSVGLQGSPFTRTLAACADGGDWTSFTALLRSMSPAAVDSELRSMQLLEGAEPGEVARLGHLLDYLDSEVILGASFEFLQALLRATLRVHGDSIMQYDGLRRKAVQIETHLRKSWTRIDSLVERVRCMVGVLGSAQM